MRPKKKNGSSAILVMGLILALTAAYYCAAGMYEGETIFEWSGRMQTILKNPVAVYLNSYTGNTVLVFLLVYFVAALMYLTSRKNYLPGREMGSAQFADVKKVNRRLADPGKDVTDPENIAVIRCKKRRWNREGNRPC